MAVVTPARTLVGIFAVLASCTGTIDGGGEPPAGQGEAEPGTPAAPRPAAPAGPGAAPSGAPPEVACTPTNLLAPRLVRLAGAELRAHLRAALPGVPAARLEEIELQGEHHAPIEQRTISAADLGALRAATRGLADDHVGALPAASPCRTDGQPRACASDTLRPLVTRLFRREPEADEWTDLEARYLALAARHGAARGTAAFLAGVLLAPQLLFHTERGEAASSADVRPLSRNEALVQARFAFTGRAPDVAETQALDRAAAADVGARLGELAAGWTRTPEFRERALDFLERWIGVETLEEVERAGGTFDAPIKSAMRAEARDFTGQAFLGAGGSFDTLLAGDLPARPAALGKLYAPAGARPVGDDRRGLLGLVGVLTAHAAPDGSDPVKRGVLVRTGLLCEPIPPPVADADFGRVTVTPEMQTRERFEVLAREPACRSCHQVINPPGYLFEAYDQLGRHRTTEKGRPIDASGTIPPAFGGTSYQGVGAWTGLGQLSDWMAHSSVARRCFAAHFASYLLAQPVPDGPQNCSVVRLAERFVGSGRLEHLAEDVARSDVFLHRARGMK